MLDEITGTEELLKEARLTEELLREQLYHAGDQVEELDKWSEDLPTKKRKEYQKITSNSQFEH